MATSTSEAIRVKDGTSGDYVAGRSGFETDSVSGQERFVQQMQTVNRQIVYPTDVEQRLSGETTHDPYDLASAPADLINNIITVGDAEKLMIAVHHTSASGECKITPVNYSGETALWFLETKTFNVDQTLPLKAASLYTNQVQTWDTGGCGRIGMHISHVGGSGNAVYVRGGVY